MRGVESVGNLKRQIKQQLSLEGLAFNLVPERLSLQQLHRNKGLAVMLVDVVDGADIGAIKSGSGFGFTPEAFECLVVLGERFRQEFGSHETVLLEVLCIVQYATSTSSEFFH